MMTINGGTAMSSPVVKSRNVLKRNSIRFAATLLAALVSLVAGPNAASVAFVSNRDRSRAGIPSHEQVRRAWNAVNAELWKGFEKMSWSDWVQRHSAVSEKDFAKDASRNRFAILLSRTNHLSYHLGQAALALK
jgi:hypothetical protein